MASSVATSGGDDVVASVAAEVAAHEPESPGRRCRNCDALAERHYCPNCGQTTVLHPPSVGEFLREFLGHHVAVEGPLWRTLGALLLTPGRLTIEYFAGRRQRYIPPLRLYLTFSLILFAVSSLQGGGLRLGNENFEFRPLKDSEQKDLHVLAPSPKKPRGDGIVDRTISRIETMSPQERTERINAGVRQYLPYVLIVLVPVLALLLKGLYWRRTMLYGEHLVVAFHAQTVAFVFSIVSALPMGDGLGSLWVLAFFIHGTIALRRVYGGGWITTVIRESLLLVVYSVFVGISLGALAMLSLVI
jgi:hypothetical protein